MVVEERAEEELGESAERLLKVAEVAQILNVHPNTVRGWNSAGLLPCYRIGPRRDRRFRLGDIYDFLSTNGNYQ